LDSIVRRDLCGASTMTALASGVYGSLKVFHANAARLLIGPTGRLVFFFAAMPFDFPIVW
jgi:hypothetical protein